jgi:glycosyltransferase involved in cell wall biosynthesis
LLVIPSRAESLPYIVLEAAAAGVAFITTRVGGIPEIFGPDSADLVAPGDPVALAAAIDLGSRNLGLDSTARARLQARVREAFSVAAMTDAVLAAYEDALSRRRG